MSQWVDVQPPKKKKDWLRKKVRLLRECVTSQAVVPVGALGRVERKANATSTIIFDVCSCCGISPVVRFGDNDGWFEFIEAAP